MVVEYPLPLQTPQTARFQFMKAIQKEVLQMASILGVSFRFIRSIDIRHPRATMERALRKANGFYNIPTDEVFLVIDNLKSVEAAKQTYLHEVVGHKGLRKILGEKTFKTLCKSIYRSMPGAMQLDYLRKYHNPVVAGDEYLARVAEQGAPASVWNSITAAIKVALNSIGIVVCYRETEVRALLQKSRQNLLREKKNEEKKVVQSTQVATPTKRKEKCGVRL